LPSAPKSPCNRPGCGEFKPCPIHSKATDKYRGTAADRGYDKKWERVRKYYLREHPLAECDRCPLKECEDRGRTIRADMVHHLKPIRTHRELRLVKSNLLAINERLCHGKIEKDYRER